MKKLKTNRVIQPLDRLEQENRWWRVLGIAIVTTIIGLVILTGGGWGRSMNEVRTGKFIRAGLCEDAIEEAVEEAVEEACDNAHSACVLECPSEVYDYDSGNYLYSTDVNSKCEDACRAGKWNCES